MCPKKTEPMVCASNPWVSINSLTWYHATFYHHNEPRAVAKFCGNQCRFPSCLVAIVQANEAETSESVISAHHREAQERRPYTRSFFNRPSNEQEMDEN